MNRFASISACLCATIIWSSCSDTINQGGIEGLEISGTQCSDNIDNDSDGLVDCDDPDCSGFVFCAMADSDTLTDNESTDTTSDTTDSEDTDSLSVGDTSTTEETDDTDDCLQGNYLIRTSLDAQALDGWTCILGELHVEAPGVLSVTIDDIRVVYGSVAIAGNSTLESVSMSALARVTGDVVLGDSARPNSALTNVDLPVLTEIGDSFFIRGNEELQDLAGFLSLQTVGGDLFIATNSRLDSLSGLNNLAAVSGRLSITDNPAMTHLDGMTGLVSIDGGIVLRNNENLTNTEALSSLTESLTGLEIRNHPSLNSLTGLSGLKTISGPLTIINNDKLVSLSGLTGLNAVGALDVSANDSLVSFTGLNGLSSIDGNFNISANASLQSFAGLSNLISVSGNLSITANPLLTTLNGLGGLNRVSGYLQVFANLSLSNISGLSSLSEIGPSIMYRDLQITSNPALPYCTVCDLYDGLVPQPDITNTAISGLLDDTCGTAATADISDLVCL